jgi:hypothetical protein
MSDEIKRIDIGEFQRLGFLQEVNRRVLHPAGLALEVIHEADGTVHLGGVWDYRDDPEGIIYTGAYATDLAEKAALVDAEIERHREARERLLGSVIQPTEPTS